MSLANSVFEAVEVANIDALRLALDQGGLVNSKDRYNETPLICAARGTATEVVELLLDSGANIDHNGEDGWTPLFYAVDRHRTDIAKLLIDRGAYIDAIDKRGKSVFYWAVSKGDQEIIDHLLRNGANLNTVTAGNKTPLMLAVSTPNNLALVKRLVSAGADVNLRPLDLFLTAVYRSVGGDGPGVLKFLKAAGLQYFELDAKGNPILDDLSLPIPGHIMVPETIRFLQTWQSELVP